MGLSHRLEIRIDDERMELLRAEARKNRRTIGAVIREAIDKHLKGRVTAERLRAVDALAELDLPVSSPSEMKTQFLEDYYCDTEGVHRRERPHARGRKR
jgi:predicted DNA-binding protein